MGRLEHVKYLVAVPKKGDKKAIKRGRQQNCPLATETTRKLQEDIPCSPVDNLPDEMKKYLGVTPFKRYPMQPAQPCTRVHADATGLWGQKRLRQEKKQTNDSFGYFLCAAVPGGHVTLSKK